MNKYKILVEGLEIGDGIQEVGDVIELSEETATPLLADGKIEAVVDEDGADEE